MKSFIIFLAFSLNAFAGTSYKLKSTTCDGNSINMFPEMSSSSFIAEFLSDTDIDFKITFSGVSDGVPFSGNIFLPLSFTNITGNRFSASKRGKPACNMVVEGRTFSFDCSEEFSESDEGEYIMDRSGSSLTLSQINYTNDNISCSLYVMNFDRI